MVATAILAALAVRYRATASDPKEVGGVRHVYRVVAPPGYAGPDILRDTQIQLEARTNADGRSEVFIKRDDSARTLEVTFRGKASPATAEELRRLCEASGVIEFRIAVPLDDPDVRPAMESLREFGPQKPIMGTGSKLWVEIERSSIDNFGRARYAVQDSGSATYVLLYDDPGHVLTHAAPTPDWRLTRAYLTQTFDGNDAVGFTFDAAGTRLFGKLTADNLQRAMAVLVEGRAITAPYINEPITGGTGQITFGRPTATRSSADIHREAQRIAVTLDAGPLPGRLEYVSTASFTPSAGASAVSRAATMLTLAAVVCAIATIVYGSALAAYFVARARVAERDSARPTAIAQRATR